MNLFTSLNNMKIIIMQFPFGAIKKITFKYKKESLQKESPEVF